MSKFYIGQKIVAIKDHSQGIFKKGDEFTVLGITKNCCNYSLNVGIEGIGLVKCLCNKTVSKFDGVWWVSERCFAPIELSTTTFEDVIKEVEPCLN